MKTRNKLIFILLAILLVAVSVLGYLWHTNRGPFQGDRIAGLPSGHIRVLETEPSPLDLLFHRHSYGGVSFNYFGESVHVYLAYYTRDELVFREPLASHATAGDHEWSGSMHWGLTIEGDQPGELRVRLISGGAMSQTYFDFSQLAFEPSLTVGSTLADLNSPIVRGKRYVLQAWQTGGFVGQDMFDPEMLARSEHTAILYIVFE